MEIKANVSLEFVNYHVSKKVTFGQKTCSCLDEQAAKLPNLPYSTDVLLKTTNTLGDAEQDAMSGDKVAIEKRNAIEMVWDKQFKQTAAYVSMVADGNIELIKSTNFSPTKTSRQRKPRITNLTNFEAGVENKKGTAYASCDKAKHAVGYVFFASSDGVNISMHGEDVILDISGVQVRMRTLTQTNTVFTGLQSAQRVNISSFAFNASGNSDITDPQTVIPQ